MVMGVEPTGVFAVVLMVRTEVAGLAPGVTGFGTKLELGHVTPAGRPVVGQLSMTGPVKPPDAVTVTVEVAEPPGAIEAGESAVAATVKPVEAAPETRKPTPCMTQASPSPSNAVASMAPAPLGKVCSTLLP
jgi:acyl dehydratase